MTVTTPKRRASWSIDLVRQRKWKAASLGLFVLALGLDLIAIQLAGHAALAVDLSSAKAADLFAVAGLLTAVVGGACGVASAINAEQGSPTIVAVLGCAYLLLFLMMV